MNYRFINLRVVLLFIVIAALAQAGCRENTLINSKVAPSGNAAGVWDTTFACITHTYYDDTVVTSTNIGGLSIYQGVGAISDPFFGTMTGATYFQVIPFNYSSSLYDNTSVDSVVLLLPFSGFTYGDTTTRNLTQKYHVFYMASGLTYDSAYFSYNTKPVDEVTPLSDPTAVSLYHLADTFSVAGVYYTKGLRIRLNTTAFMNRIAPAQAILSSSTTPQADFVKLFNGLCVRVADPTQTNTAIPYVRLDGSNLYDRAGVNVYYHHTNVAPVDTVVENYYFDPAYCAHFNSISNSFASAPVNNLYHSTQANDSIVALQNQPGASIDVVIPGLNKMPKGVINKAELQFTLLPNYLYSNLLLQGPEKIYPLGIGNGKYPIGVTNGVAYSVLDRYPLTSLTPLGVLDGFVHTFVRNGTTVATYTIDIPREVMASVAAKNDTIHLHINGTQDYYGAFHMVAGGGSYPDTLYRPKLFVVYSKLNK